MHTNIWHFILFSWALDSYIIGHLEFGILSTQARRMMSLLLLICLKAQFLKIIINALGLTTYRFHLFKTRSVDQYKSLYHFATLPAIPGFGSSSFHISAVGVCFDNYFCIKLVVYFIPFNKNAQKKRFSVGNR